jgi:hypothetical protein
MPGILALAAQRAAARGSRRHVESEGESVPTVTTSPAPPAAPLASEPADLIADAQSRARDLDQANAAIIAEHERTRPPSYTMVRVLP